VTVAAIADEVDDDIAAKLRAILGAAFQPARRRRIFAIDVKDGTDCAWRCRRRSGRNAPAPGGGEANQIVDDDVNGAADV